MKSIFLFLFAFLSIAQQIIATENMAQAQAFMAKKTALFEENKGQVTGADASKVNFVYKEGALSVFLLKTGIAYQFNKTHYPKGYKHLDKFASTVEREHMETLAKDIRIETYRMDVSLVNANPNAKITTEGKSADYIQYYNHNALDIYSYSKITYHEVYPNIDWVIYKTSTQLKYDFVVRPGGNPNQIKLQTSDVEDLTLNQDGSVTLKNRMGTITEQSPISFQNEKQIASSFNLQNNTIAFNVDSYDPTQTLTIDPSLEWATYYGGNGGDEGLFCTLDNSDNVYLVGRTFSYNAIASGGHQNTKAGASNWDAFLVKLNSFGIRQWATYYGGSNTDMGYSCAIDSLGNVYLAGYTTSDSAIAFGGHQNNIFPGYDESFLVKFNSNGIRQWGTYYGGSSHDVAYSCAVDILGNVYLVGVTSSINVIASGGHQNTYGGGFLSDAFIVKFSADGIRQWATYYGASSADRGSSCAVDGAGNVYLAGHTTSTSAIAYGGHQNTYGGNNDAFLVKFNSAGVRQWGTYYGGSNEENGYSCTLDGSGNVFLAGETGSQFGIASGGHQSVINGGGGDAFLVKFNSNGIRQWGTYYGGNDSDIGFSTAVDGIGNVYLSGETVSTSYIAFDGYQNIKNGFSDAFLVKFDNNGVRQWGTYYGGSSIESGASCAVDSYDNVYMAGETQSTSNIASNGHQNTYGGGTADAFLLKFERDSVCTTTSMLNESICSGDTYLFGSQIINVAGVYIDTMINVGGCDSIITLTLIVHSLPTIAISQNGSTLEATLGFTSYQWFLNDTLIVGATSEIYTTTQNGTYMVIVADSNGCSDTASYIYISVGINSIFLNITNIYPNPSSGKIYLNNIPKGVQELKIYNSMGQMVYSSNAMQNEVDLSNQPKGVYFILLSGLKDFYRATVVLD